MKKFITLTAYRSTTKSDQRSQTSAKKMLSPGKYYCTDFIQLLSPNDKVKNTENNQYHFLHGLCSTTPWIFI